MRLRRVFPALAAFTAGCVEQATVPRAPEQKLDMRLSVSSPVIARGESATLTVSLTNTRDEVVRLWFKSTCQVVLTIRDSRGRIVATSDTSECTSVPSLITLAVGQTQNFPFTWSGESRLGAPGSGTPLAPGQYYASATMTSEGYTGIAFPILIELRN